MVHVYSVDHGNKYIKVELGNKPALAPAMAPPENWQASDQFHDADQKAVQKYAQSRTRRELFLPAGLEETETPPAFSDDILYYNRKYYTLSDERIPYMRDKTEDDRYFILTLFAIARKHLDAYPRYAGDDVLHIDLLIGLPPEHFIPLRASYEKYFYERGQNCNFIFNDIPFSICVDRVFCNIQAHAAVAPIISQVSKMPRAIIVDIGGYTADLLQLTYGEVDRRALCKSMEHGTIQFYNLIIERARASFSSILIHETEIDRILRTYPRPVEGRLTMAPDEYEVFDEDLIRLITKEADLYISDFFNKLREQRIDLRTCTTIFVGGGTILFRKMIDRQIEMGKLRKTIFFTDICANTNGYLLLYRARQRAAQTASGR